MTTIPLKALKDHVKPGPLPQKRPDQHFQPVNNCWIELDFNYRINLGPIKFTSYDRIVKWLKEDSKWGERKKDWTDHVWGNDACFYFMDRDLALDFRLSVEV